MSDSTRLRWVTWIVIAACLAGMALCPHLWFGARSFPVIPLVPGARAPGLAHEALSLALVASLIGCGLRRGRRWFTLAACVAALALITLDISRLQPWLYLYLFILAIVATRRTQDDDHFALNTLRLLFVFVYAFSALHKLNASFFHDTGRLILQPLAKLLPDTWPVRMLAYPIPLVEISLAALLLFNRTRKLGVILACVMHACILLLIGPLGLNHNSVVWPWNLAMGALVFVLFWGPSAVRALAIPSRTAAWARRVTFLLAGIVPIGGVFRVLDRYITWNMYGGAPPMMAVWMNAEMESRLPTHLKPHIQTLSPGSRGIIILDWSMHDLNVAYPQLRVLRAAAVEVARSARRPSDGIIVTVQEPHWWTGQALKGEQPVIPNELNK